MLTTLLAVYTIGFVLTAVAVYRLTTVAFDLLRFKIANLFIGLAVATGWPFALIALLLSFRYVVKEQLKNE